jgi:hypothetical protein
MGAHVLCLSSSPRYTPAPALTKRLPLVKTPNMELHRITERISPLWLGIGISGSLLLILFTVETVLGRWSEFLIDGEFDPLASVSTGVLRDVRMAIVHCLIMGYLPAAFLHALRSGRRTVLALQQTLDCTPKECRSLAASIRLTTRGLVITGLAGLLLALAMPYAVPPVSLHPWSPSTWGPEVVWHRLLGPAAMVWVWWLGYAIISVSMRMSRIAKTLCVIDLLNLSPLAPFTQLGLGNALLLVGSLSIWSLMLIETGLGQVAILIGGTTLVLTALALLTPVHGVHKRIRKSKEEALNWVNDVISEQRISFQGAEAGHRSGRMADLIAYRGMIESVPEWPFTMSTFTRLALYVLLPVATWGISLVAEEILQRIIL